MKTFRYEGVSISGTRVEGRVEAFDRQDAVIKAREHCRRLVLIEQVHNSKLETLLNADMEDIFAGRKIKAKVLSLLCSQLAIELKAGLPLVSSLRLVAENETDKRLQKLLTEVADDVHAGNGLAESFALRGPGLPNSFVETVRAGEESGRLAESFERLKKYYEDSAAVSAKVGNAMIYPAMLIAVAIVVIAIIMMTAVPVFEEAFASQGNELPLPTKMLMGLSHFMVDNAALLFTVVAIGVILLILFGKTERGRHEYARLALSIPGIRLVNQMKGAAQLCTTLSTLLASGLPMVRAVEIAGATLDNLLIAEEVQTAASGILEGRRMSDGLRKSKWLPKLLIEMTAVGEETGSLEDTLGVVSEYYNKEVDSAVKKALEILNPTITIVLAIIVVFILLSVYMPLFSMYGAM